MATRRLRKMSQKQKNRERWPEMAEFVDNMRDAFGDVKVIAVYEHGRLVMGKPDPFVDFVQPTDDYDYTQRKRK